MKHLLILILQDQRFLFCVCLCVTHGMKGSFLQEKCENVLGTCSANGLVESDGRTLRCPGTATLKGQLAVLPVFSQSNYVRAEIPTPHFLANHMS